MEKRLKSNLKSGAFSSLAMYDFPHIRPEWQRLYRFVTNSIPTAPKELTYGDAAFDWMGDVFLSMTCGCPYRNRLHQRLSLIGTLDFGLGRPGYYHSIILGRHGPRVAVNSLDSQSGFHAVMNWSGGGDLVVSGSHWNSIKLVLAGEVDFCGVDAVTYGFLTELYPEYLQIPILDRTEETPGLPLVSSHPELCEPIFEALSAGLDSEPNRLGIKGIVKIEDEAYFAVRNWEQSQD